MNVGEIQRAVAVAPRERPEAGAALAIPTDRFEPSIPAPILIPRPVESTSDRELNDPLPAVQRPGTRDVVDEMRDHDRPLPDDGERTFAHQRTDGAMFTADGNWADIGTAVAADQFAAMTACQQDEFRRITGAAPEEIRAGDGSLMELPPTKDFEHMDAPCPAITYCEIDYSRIGHHTIHPEWLVIHYTAMVDDTPESVWAHFNRNKGIPSTQFIVGKDGAILQIMPETQKCDGTLDFNANTVQIEVCGNFRQEKETDAEFSSTVALVKYLQKKYQIPDTQIISHRQVDNNFHHVGRKPDPTFHFMNRLYETIR